MGASIENQVNGLGLCSPERRFCEVLKNHRIERVGRDP